MGKRNTEKTSPKLSNTLCREMGGTEPRARCRPTPKSMFPGMAGNEGLRPKAQSLWCPHFFTDSLDSVWLYFREILESTRKGLLLSKNMSTKQTSTYKGTFMVFSQTERLRQRRQTASSAPSSSKWRSQMRTHPTPRLRHSKLNPSFKSPFNRKQTGKTNCCFGNVCIISDQTL